MSLKLYELPPAFAVLDSEIEAADGELSEALEGRLEALEATLEDRVDAVAVLVRQADLEASGYQAEIERLTARRRVAENRRDRLKAYLKRTLETLGRDRVNTARFSVRIQRNSAPSIRWGGSPNTIPEEFARVTVDLDGVKARRAWEAGELPDGFDVVLGTHLRIS